MNIYERIGVKPCINAMATVTFLGGSLMPPEVMEAMREGLWENLNFRPPAFTTGKMIEFAACGTKELSFEALQKVIRFEDVDPHQIAMFTRVLEAFTSEQRSQFLKFSTGRVRLPPQDAGFYVRVDSPQTGRDRLPTASTCFNQFHLPTYSSFDKAFQMIGVAISYTGTFEQR